MSDSTLISLSTHLSNTTEYNLSTERYTTDEIPFQPLPLYLFIIWFVIGVHGNVIAITILIRIRSKHKWRLFYKLVLMLTLSDFLGQLITLPIMISSYSNKDILKTGGTLCNTMSTITVMTSFMSISFVCLMSIDRAIASWFPIFYRNSIKSWNIGLVISGVILVAICLGILPLVGVNKYKLQREGTWCFVDLHPTQTKDKVFLYLSASIGILAVLIMLMMNGMVLYRLCRIYSRTERQNKRISRAPTVSSGVKKIQTMFFLFTIMTVFMSSWIPIIVRIITNAIEVSDIDHVRDRSAVALAVIHQVLNPWVYIIMQECLFSRCLEYARKHSKRGSIFHRILDDTTTKETEMIICKRRSQFKN
ncbi:prostaglandin E2 receptor EP4 subtype-like [Ylistrum balloti]|uniref:prostaglandin E2 receptor EP4 subtype-like n=1 Tax=Ylistrum balloti TaxID=509963 RepID=UPI0029059C68|nr:prostaglandin E2 receptor EP4 subtype-like [Ylistrum balloti]